MVTKLFKFSELEKKKLKDLSTTDVAILRSCGVFKSRKEREACARGFYEGGAFIIRKERK